MTAPLFVSFHAGPGYAAEAAALEASLRERYLWFLIEELSDAGSWVANCAQKPAFMRRMREMHHGPIVWLDADARVMREPELFDQLECDFAVHYFKGVQLASGTLYFGDTQPARDLIGRWCAEQAEHPQDLDQDTLARSWCSDGKPWPGLAVAPLPEEYCAIFDRGVQDPVILHGQASRRLKRRTRHA